MDPLNFSIQTTCFIVSDQIIECQVLVQLCQKPGTKIELPPPEDLFKIPHVIKHKEEGQTEEGMSYFIKPFNDPKEIYWAVDSTLAKMDAASGGGATQFLSCIGHSVDSFTLQDHVAITVGTRSTDHEYTGKVSIGSKTYKQKDLVSHFHAEGLISLHPTSNCYNENGENVSQMRYLVRQQ